MNATRSSKARLLNARIASTCAVPSARATRASALSASIYISLLITCRPKSDKYFEGYPGDTEETFLLSQKEMRGGETHHPPRRDRPTLDEDAVKSVDERMKNLDVSSQASAA